MVTRLTETLRRLADRHRMRLFGVADLQPIRKRFGPLPAEIRPELVRAVVMGFPLQRGVLDTIDGQPNPLYFHHYRQVNYQLDRAALAVADQIQEQGYRSVAVAASQIVHRDPMLGHLPHKLMAWYAGLGWMGRNNLLVNPRWGSAVRYVTVLTDMELPVDGPIDGSCGGCRACVAKCPAGAIHESFKDFELDKCYDQLCDFVRRHVVGQHVCGVCVAACRGKKT